MQLKLQLSGGAFIVPPIICFMYNNWKKYHQGTKDRIPSKLLVEALAYIKNKGKALDLGAGALVESKLLLSKNFEEVTAVDIVPFEKLDNPRFHFIESSFENFSFPKNKFDIVNANLALPFTKPESFNKVWLEMKDSIVKNGIFSGQLFGVNDGWNVDGSEMTFHTKTQVEELLSGFAIKKLEEIEKIAPLVSGGDKHWHIFAIIAEKV